MLSLFFMLFSAFAAEDSNSQEPTYQCNKAIETVADFTSAQFWEHAEWIPYFVDLRTGNKATLATRAKLLWDDSKLYIMVEMLDSHLWAEQTEHEERIYLDNAFELFIDPDGDGLNYIEYEINALGTTWDLLMAKPYREGGDAISNFDMKKIEKKIVMNGTINNPNDIDMGWILYLAIPFENFRGLCPKPIPERGDTWRMNLVRVHWELDIIDQKYLKTKNVKTGRDIVNYWVWSPHGVINMHKPESFGHLTFY